MGNRSVIETMVLVFTFVVAFAIVGLSVMILIVEVKNPEADTGLIANTLMTLVGGILGALLGLIAGKSDAMGDLHHRPGGGENGMGGDPP